MTACVLVLQGLGPCMAAQARQAERLCAGGFAPTEVHAVSSGVVTALYLAALRAGCPVELRESLFDAELERLLRSCFLRPWRLTELTRVVEEKSARVEKAVGAEQLDAAVASLRIRVYYHGEAGRRLVDLPETWKELKEAARKSGSIPFLCRSSSAPFLDGIVVHAEELRPPPGGSAADVVTCASAFPSVAACFLYALGLQRAEDFVAPLRFLSAGAASSGLMDSCSGLILLLLVLSRRGERWLRAIGRLLRAAVGYARSGGFCARLWAGAGSSSASSGTAKDAAPRPTKRRL